MVKSRVKINEIVDDVKKDIIVCDVDKRQMQSSFILINGEIHYCVMYIRSNYNNDHYTHGCSVEVMREYIEKYPGEYFNIYDLEHVGYTYVRARMKELQEKFGREYKINQLVD